MKKLVISYLFFLIVIVSTLGQTQSFYLSGFITNIKNEPIPFAHVMVKESSFGTITNESGFFQIDINTISTNSYLIVSHIGYKTDTSKIDKFQKNLIIILQNCNVLLEEITVYPITAFEIIERVKDSIRSNYYQGNFKLSTFYRSIQYVDNNLNEVVEAIIDVYRKGYGEFSKRKLKKRNYFSSYPIIIKGRYQKIQQYDWESNFNMYGQISKENFTDPIEIASANFFGNNDIYDYHFKVDSSILFENEPIWVISYTKVKELGYKFHGQLFIRKKDFVLIKLTTFMKRGEKPIAKARIPFYKLEVNNSFLEYTFTTFENKWIIYSRNFQFDFSILTKKHTYNVQMSDFFVVQDITPNIEINEDSIRTKSYKMTLHDYFDEYSPQFWESYDYIPYRY